MFAWAFLGLANVYYGRAQRAIGGTLAQVQHGSSPGLSRSMADHAEVRHAVAAMVLELEGIGSHLEAVAQAWVDGVDHGPAWGPQPAAAAYRAVEGIRRVVDRALGVAGGCGIYNTSGLERLARDAHSAVASMPRTLS
jgi:alkylation response protein AidB-like acyl-CoA dehydrogenase